MRLRILAAAAVLFALVGIAAALFFVLTKNTMTRVSSDLESFDVVYQLPGSPQGAASNGRELMLGNRQDPWGAMRIRARGESFSAEIIPIRERRYNQKMQISTLTWNGTYYVGLASASWFGKKTGDVFTVHDPKSMSVVSYHAAPDFLGCLAWDGESYWAATRRNTADAPEPKNIYQLDEDFAVIGTYDAPSVGCQGMVWDGARLWLVDVFDDSIYVLDVRGDAPKVVHRAYSGLEYLSGILSFDGALWVTEYGNDRLHRIRPELRTAWSGVPPPRDPARGQQVAAADVFANSGSGNSGGSINDASVIELQQQLRSDDWAERQRAEFELDRRGEPIDFARRENRSPDRGEAETEDIDWSVEMRDGAIYGTWRLWFGPDLFHRGESASDIITIPQFAKYTFTVKLPDGKEIEKEFEATAGENFSADVFLADAALPGEYSISLFMHVQYISPEGEARILNDSAAGLDLRK